MNHQPQDSEAELRIDPLTGVHNTLHDVQQFAYHEWKLHGKHYEEYACEFLGTTLLVMAVVGAVAIVQAARSPVAAVVSAMPARLLLTGFIIAFCGMVITISPFGKLSGAHLNPAVSFGFWMLGKLGIKDTIGYIGSQMAGGLLGAVIAKPAFGMLAREVKYAAMAPGAHISVITAFSGEFACTFVMTLAIFYFVSHSSLARWTPFMLLALIPFLVLFDGTVSGCGMNPARWIGPAYIAHIWQAAWIYLVGPIGGTALAVFFRKSGLASSPVPVTAKLFHDINYRSLFKHDQMPTKAHGMPQPQPGDETKKRS